LVAGCSCGERCWKSTGVRG